MYWWSARRLVALPIDSADEPTTTMTDEDIRLVFAVPADHFFAMGDNRDNSLDSRVAPEDGGVGYVPAENLVARADVMLGSYDFLNARSARTWLGQIRLSRFLRPI